MTTPPTDTPRPDPSASDKTGAPPTRGKSKRRDRRVTLAKLLNEMWLGRKTPVEIVADLGMTMARLRLVLNGPSFRQGVEFLACMAEHRQRIVRAMGALRATESLLVLAAGEGETARRACVDLLALGVTPGLPTPAGVAPEELPQCLLERQVEAMLEHLADSPGGASELQPARPSTEVQP
jgi:hypothetical protein